MAFDRAVENLIIPAEVAELNRANSKGKRRSASIAEIKEPAPIQVESIDALLAEEEQVEIVFCEKLKLFHGLAQEYAVYPSLCSMIQLVQAGLADKARHKEVFKKQLIEMKQHPDARALGSELVIYKKHIQKMKKGIAGISEVISRLQAAANDIEKNENEWAEVETFLTKIKKNETLLSYPMVGMLHAEISQMLQKKEAVEQRFLEAMDNTKLDEMAKSEIEQTYLMHAKEELVTANKKLSLIVKIHHVFSKQIFHAETEKDNIKEAFREISTYAKGAYAENEDVAKILSYAADETKTRANLEVAKEEEQEKILMNDNLSIEEKIEQLDAAHQEYIGEILNANGAIWRIVESLRGKILELSLLDAATLDFMQAIEENVKAYQAAYPQILEVDEDYYSYCLSQEVTSHLLTIAKKIQSDYSVINSSVSDIKRHAVLRQRENCTKVESINQAKEKYIKDFTELSTKLNQYYAEALQRVVLATNEKIEIVKTEECQIKQDLLNFLEKLKACENKSSLTPFEDWEKLADFREELNKLHFQLALYQFEKKVLSRIAKVKTYTYDDEYDKAYDTMLERIKKSTYKEDCWVKLKEEQDEFALFVKKEKEALIAKLKMRTAFTQPIKDFCVVLQQQIDLIKAEPDSLEKTARLTMLNEIKANIEEIRNQFLKHLIGGAKEAIQEDKFKKDISAMLKEELLTKKGLEKITDIIVKQRLTRWLRDLLKPLYEFIHAKIKKKRFYSFPFASKQEKVIAATAEKVSNDFLEPKPTS